MRVSHHRVNALAYVAGKAPLQSPLSGMLPERRLDDNFNDVSAPVVIRLAASLLSILPMK